MRVSSQESVPVNRSPQTAASLQMLFQIGTLGGLSDGQLLERFLSGGRAVAEAAFTLLVQRHGPMVLSVCQGVLRDRHDAEDVFQATFLVLARQAGAIRREDAVASWLYGVARRLSLRSRRRMAQRRELEQRRQAALGYAEPATAPPPEPWPDLYEELDRLPEPFRAAVVLCDLEGKSYDQAAELMHCPVGTIQSRLSRGRQRLRSRLERRGLGPALGVVGPGPFTSSIMPGVPQTLTQKVVAAAVSVAGGESIRSLAPAVVLALVGSELRRHLFARILAVVGTLGVAAFVVAGAGMLAGGQREKGRDIPRATTSPSSKASTGPVHVRVVDGQGNGVPGIAVELVIPDMDILPRTLETDATGSIMIPREEIGYGISLLARRGDDALAWVQISEQDSKGPMGTRAEPILMRFQPLTHRVEGSVVDQQGKPIAGAKVVAPGLFQAGTGSSPGPSFFHFGLLEASGLPRTRTDPAGRFALVLPEAANASLGVQHPRYIAQRAGVKPDARTLDPIVMEPAGTIAGRVVDAVTGQPVPRVLLASQLIEDHHRMLGGWGETRADDQGRFAISGLEPGVYNLLFENAPGRPRATAKAVEGVRVRAGQSTAALMKVIEGRPLRGVVINRATKQPAAGVQVGYCGPARPRSGAAVQTQKTDLQGAFTLHVPPGENFVYLMELGSAFSRLSKCTADVPEEGELEPIRLVLVPQAAQAQPRDMAKAWVPAKDAAPAPKPSAMMKMKSQVAKAAVPPPQAGLAQGVAIAKAEAQQPAPGQEPAVRTVTGRVRDAQGQPLAGVRVEVSQVRPFPALPRQFPDMAATDREGVFVLDGIPRQPLQISLGREGFDFQQVDLPADRDQIECTYRLTPDAPSGHRPVPRGDDPIPAEVRERWHFIDLANSDSEPLTDGPGGSGNDLNRLPRGIRNFDGLYFRVGEDMVHLAGTATFDLPREVKGIPVQARGQKLHFLHAVQQSVPPGTEVGAYVMHYTDGSTERIPIVYGRDLVNWWLWGRGFEEVPTEARVAWTGMNDTVEKNNGLKVRLFARTWTNPHPEKEIASLDVLSAGTLCDPFLVAATLERDR